MIDLKQEKILVTGAHGFLGKYIIRNLTSKRGVDFKNISQPSSSELDLRVWKNCQKAVENQTLVIHLAANVGGIGYNQNYPGSLFYDNLLMGVQLIEAARLAKVKKIVALGTVCAYPKFTPTPFKEEDIWNGYPEETNAPYGLAKKMLLVQTQAYRQQYDFNAIYLLPANMYGPGDNFSDEKSHVIAALIKKIHHAKANSEPKVIVWGTGKPTREFLYIQDAAEGILQATERYDENEPMNIGTGVETSIIDLTNLICKIMNYQGTIVWDKSKPDGQSKRRLDISRAQKEINFTAQTSLENGLIKTIDWYINK